MANTCTIDAKALFAMFDGMGEDTRQEWMLKALKAGGKVLQENTRQNLIKTMGAAATSTNRFKKPMTSGVKLIVDKGYNEVIVSIMPHYLLRFFESGTDERYLRKDHPKDETHRKTLKKGEYRGKVDGKHFFEDARQNTDPIIEAIELSLYESISKQK